MPAFTFEKLSPPRRSPVAAAEPKPRSRIVQFLDRFTEARARRALSKERPEVQDPQKPSE